MNAGETHGRASLPGVRVSNLFSRKAREARKAHEYSFFAGFPSVA
ncbi:hypothetical protein U27_03190 [Candidatus Vecturithrix granuli]|uniref:Uncharacterized protein n=1 Tax=Vecturithrix granuli TaxID=1499967 RepID=A0A081BV73_VECG1|nr:hypothetical protein U27_03190 [Candidatus Vecturithrix granuli]